MKPALVFLVLLIFLSGCALSLTGGSIVTIEDVPDKEAQETAKEKIAEPKAEKIEPQPPQEEKKEEPKAEIKEAPKEPEANEETKKNIIEIKDKKFIPETLVIKSGTKVVWKHNDILGENENKQHMIRIYPIGEKSTALNFGEEFEYTFTEPKEYYYVDMIHTDTMKRGIVVVEP